jgi:hypothetical protein
MFKSAMREARDEMLREYFRAVQTWITLHRRLGTVSTEELIHDLDEVCDWTKRRVDIARSNLDCDRKEHGC